MIVLTDQNTILTTPRLNEPAPEFAIQTTHGYKRLIHFRGQWLLLSFHPLDLNDPICTTEILAIAACYQEFRALNCELIGIPTGVTSSHSAWLQIIQQNFDFKIPFPMAEGPVANVSRAYIDGTTNRQAHAVARNSFVIDNNGILRAIVHAPLTKGRSVSEILRSIAALQAPELALPKRYETQC